MGDTQAHTFGDDCPPCGDGRSGTRCDLSTYSARRVRFILAHKEAFTAAYLNASSAAASNELERLNREYDTLPSRHDCSCRCPNELHGRMRCSLCKALDAQRPKGPDVAVSIGRTAMAHPPTPAPMMLDLERAIAVVGPDDPRAIAKYMSLNGTSLAPVDRNYQWPTLPPIEGMFSPIPTSPPPLEDTRTCTCVGYMWGGAARCVHLTPAA